MKLKDAIRTMRFSEKGLDINQLYTPWGENINPDTVLPEYPRPQLKRDNYLILNGYWNYCISSDQIMPPTYHGKILVPFSPESVLSGVSRHLKPEEILWYERIVMIDRKPKGKRCILHFGAVDQFCEVYINHQKVTEHMGGYIPFEVEITNMLEIGVNLLSLKVIDVSDTSYHSRGKQKQKRGGMFYTPQSGIWQTVWMEWVPDLYIKSLRFTPLVDQAAVRVEVYLNEDVDYDMLNGIIFEVGIYEEQEFIKAMQSESQFITIPMPDFTHWSPENPHLYDVVIRVGEDRVESYFAMRKIEVRNDDKGLPRIYLNNQLYFQNGVLDQGYWPDGLYTPPSDEAFIFDIIQAKRLGYNMIRKHLKIEPLRWYYHCDRLGMLVWQDMVNGGESYNTLLVGYVPTLFPWLASKIKDHHYRMFGRKNKEGRDEWIKECKETVTLLYNCPSIVIWVPFNEGWGQFDAAKIYEIIRELDNTRLVDHASGWFDQKCGDFESIHNYFHPMKSNIKSRPYILSEYGGYACFVTNHTYSNQVFGYRIYLTEEDLNKAYHTLLERDIKALIDMGLSAAVYTQISDVEDEVNGLFTYDRKVCKVTPIELITTYDVLSL